MDFETTIILLVIGFVVLLLGWFFLYRFVLVQLTYKHRRDQSKQLRFLQVKISKNTVKSSEWDTWDSIWNMKQNMEIMNQIYKNLYSIFNDDWKYTHLWNNYVSFEIFIEKEIIKFIIWVPIEHLEPLEKIIWGFYPWSVIEPIEQPKILETWKYIEWWEFTLIKDNIFPIRTYESFEADPMDSILSAYSKVFVDEKLSLQLLIEPLHENLFKELREKTDKSKKKKKSMMKKLFELIKMNDKKEEKEEKNYDFSQNQLGDLDKKLNDEIFNIKIRAITTSPSPNRPKKIIDDLAKSFFQYTYTGLNWFKFKHAQNISKFTKAFTKRSFDTDDWLISKMKNFWKKQILNIKELSSIIHFPHPKFNKNPRLSFQNYKIVAWPDNLPNDGILLWWNTYMGNKKEIRFTNEDRFRHLYIVWQTGTGKSTLLLTLALEDLKAGNWFCTLDPHWDLAEYIIERFPKERIDDLIYFDLANTEYPLAFNPLDWTETEDERDVVTNDLIEMFVSLYGEEIFGPRIQDYFRNACFLLMEQDDWWTLVDIMRLFTDDAFAESKIRNIKSPVIAAWRNKTYKKMGDREKGEIIPFLQAKFAPFTTSTYVRNIIGQPKSAFNFGQAMQEKKVILCNMSKWLVGEENSKLIGRMIAMQIKQAALKRASIESKDRVPFFLYVDEFQNYVSKSFESILSEARKYKLWLGIAHQYMDQLKQWWLSWELDLSKTILGNVWSIMAFKIGPNDAEVLENIFAPDFSKWDLMNSETFKWAMRLSIDKTQSKPFSISCKVVYWEKHQVNSPEKIAIMKQISALKWWTKRELVDKEIYFRVWV